MECEFILKTKEGQAIALTEAEAKDLYETLKKFFEKSTTYISIPTINPNWWTSPTFPSGITTSYTSNNTLTQT